MVALFIIKKLYYQIPRGILKKNLTACQQGIKVTVDLQIVQNMCEPWCVHTPLHPTYVLRGSRKYDLRAQGRKKRKLVVSGLSENQRLVGLSIFVGL